MRRHAERGANVPLSLVTAAVPPATSQQPSQWRNKQVEQVKHPDKGRYFDKAADKLQCGNLAHNCRDNAGTMQDSAIGRTGVKPPERKAVGNACPQERPRILADILPFNQPLPV